MKGPTDSSCGCMRRAGNWRGRYRRTTSVARLWNGNWVSSRRRQRARPMRRCSPPNAVVPLRIEAVQTIPTGGLSLVGRASEWARLTTLWRETRRGRAQVVLLSGEPGVGKTRLAEEFRSWCARTRSRDRGSPLLRERRRHGLRAVGQPGCVRPRSPRASSGSIARILPRWPRCCPTLSPSPSSPSCRSPDPMPSSGGVCSKPPLGPSSRREDRCCSSPMICNGATRRPFSSSITSCGSSRDSRSSWRPQRGERRSIRSHPLNALIAGLHALERFTEIEVGRLTREETAMLAEQLADHDRSGKRRPSRLFRETEGNPLFVVEALRAGWSADGERGTNRARKCRP